jgi:glycine hydroxymethyltransferase
MACLKPGDTILGMNLSHGGHLTHGSPVNFSGQTYKFIAYGVSPENEQLDYDEIRKLALEHKPKMIVCGATAYARAIDFKKFAEIAQEVNAYLHADISHIAGLIVGKQHMSPVGYADTIMTTTHKTLKGPRSAVIMSTINDRYQALYHPDSKKNLAQRIDSAIFPGLQGGPLEHVVAAKAIAFKEAMTPEFTDIQKRTVEMCKVLAEVLSQNGIRVISGGTDTHLVLIDCMSINLSGKQAATLLETCGIYTNFNTIPLETRTPFDPSGLRIGTSALASRGMNSNDAKEIAQVIVNVLKSNGSEESTNAAKLLVSKLTKQYPIYKELF